MPATTAPTPARTLVGSPNRYWVTLAKWLSMPAAEQLRLEKWLTEQRFELAIDSSGDAMPCHGLRAAPAGEA